MRHPLEMKVAVPSCNIFHIKYLMLKSSSTAGVNVVITEDLHQLQNMGGDDPVTRVPVRFVVTVKGNVTEALSAAEVRL